MVHLGVDIDQFILYTIYPAAAFFAVGYVAKKTKMRQLVVYLAQAAICFSFSVAYFILVPNGGAQGLAVVLAMFGAVLLLMARKQKVHHQEEPQVG